MAGTANRLETLRLNRRETERLSLALALSLAAHLFAWGGYEIGREFGFWQRLPRLAWFLPAPKVPPPQAQNREQPLEFVMVNQPSTEPPQNAKYYSSQNSIAANPDANRNEKNPQLNGKQTEVPKAESVTKPDFNKLQPTPQRMSRPQAPSPAVAPGDLTLASPKELQQQSQDRPRTLAQVTHRLPGLQMLQNGGVQAHAIVPSFDTKATLLGDYDAAFIDAVQQYWDDELDRINYGGAETGKVVLQFHLNYDGRVSDLEVLNSTVGQMMTLMCETAILNPAPYAAWPEDMRHLIGANYREITFTFYYY